jgi:hypothetical protein
MLPKKLLTGLTILVLSVALVSCYLLKPKVNEELFPEGYRHWMLVKTGLVGPRNILFDTIGGFHHIYANDKAINGYRSGKFPEGSILVFDKIEMLEQKDGTIREGRRKWVDVMIKQSSHNDSTGGWKFMEFPGDSRTPREFVSTKKQCFNCHATKKESQYVFSILKE